MDSFVAQAIADHSDDSRLCTETMVEAARKSVPFLTKNEWITLKTRIQADCDKLEAPAARGSTDLGVLEDLIRRRDGDGGGGGGLTNPIAYQQPSLRGGGTSSTIATSLSSLSPSIPQSALFIMGATILLAVVGVASWFSKASRRASHIPTSHHEAENSTTPVTNHNNHNNNDIQRENTILSITSQSTIRQVHSPGALDNNNNSNNNQEDLPYLTPPNRLSSFMSRSLSNVSKKSSLRNMFSIERSTSTQSSQKSISNTRQSQSEHHINGEAAKQLAGKTTTDVCRELVVPMTTVDGITLSLCDRLALEEEVTHRHQNVAAANWFVSHVWSYEFISVVDAMERFFAGKQIAVDDAVVWMDLFCVPQFGEDAEGLHEQKFDWWRNTMMSTIKQCKNLVLVVDQQQQQQDWSELVPLQRLWCVFELFAASASRSAFHVALTEASEASLVQSLHTDPGLIHDAVAGFRSEVARATKLRDQQMLQKVLRHNINNARLNEMIKGMFRNWVLEFIDSQITNTPFLTNDEALVQLARWFEIKSDFCELRDLLPKAKEALEECLSLREEYLGQEHPDTLRTRSQLAYLSSRMGEDGFAELTLSSCLETQRDVLGSSHPDTLATMARLASAYGHHHLYNESVILYNECLATAASDLGDSSSPFVVATTLDFASLHQSNHRYKEALALYQQAHSSCLATLGESHKSTLLAALGVAQAQFHLQNYPASERAYHEITDLIHETFGTSSAQAWEAQIGLARNYEHTARIPESVDILAYVERQQQLVLGPNHAATLQTAAQLACVRVARGDAAGEAQLAAAHARQAQLFGGDAAAAQFSQFALAAVFFRRRRFAAARALLLPLAAVQTRALGGADAVAAVRTRVLLAAATCRCGDGDLKTAIREVTLCRETLAAALGADHVWCAEADRELDALVHGLE
ncbi:hypothetical protein BDR26DRAFT_1009093 [Obelidium mucronatum]|nr:hypothetical protein BDR26DRAFT_1009093 [Obelidium mucronatum]